MHIRNTDLDGLSQQHGIPWRDSDAICPADGHAMSHPVRAVNGTQERHAGKVTILLETQGTGGNYLTLPLWETPSATPASSKIY